MSKNGFKVIIVGGGIVGLTAAHALSASGIDYVLLEKRKEIAPESGAGFGIWPPCLRFYDQIGILEKLLPHGSNMYVKREISAKGQLKRETPNGIKEKFGYNLMFFERRYFLTALYKALGSEDREHKIRLGIKVADIKIQGDGVSVILEDGSEVTGSIVVGADGIYSKTRSTALRLHNAEHKSAPKQGLPIHSRYTSYFARIPSKKPSVDCMFHETHAKHLGVQLFTTNESHILSCYKWLEKPHETVVKYNDRKQIDAWLEPFHDIHVDERTKMKDILSDVEWDLLADQEEGMSDILHYGGRIVLVGDAVCKLTSVTGTGGNEGIQGVISLVNQLTQVLTTSVGMPSAAELDVAFRKYEKDSLPGRRKALEGDDALSRQLVWADWIAWIQDRILIPIIGQEFLIDKMLCKRYLRYGKLLQSLPQTGLKEGSIPWVYA